MFKTSTLSRANIETIIGCVMNEYDGQQCIVPAWRRGMSNTVWNASSGDGDGGDRVISPGGYGVDGNLLLTVGWGDGFAVRQLNDDGSMTKLFHETYALYRDTSSTYNHINSLTIHKPSKKAVIMTHNVNGYSVIDYSGCVTGGTAVIEPRPPSQYFISNGVSVDRAGSYYENGLVTAGDWIYVGDYDATHYKKFPRRNIVTGTEEVLDGTTHALSGSAVIDRNGYRYTLHYDEVNDRVFYCPHYNGNFMVVLDASTASPKLVWCDAADVGMGDDGYEHGLFVPDPINKPNELYIEANSRIAFVDITPCMTGGSMTIIKQFFTEDGTVGQRFSNHFRAGTIYQGLDGEVVDKSVLYPDFVPTSADRGRNQLDGWLDTENGNIVGVYRYNNTTEDTTSLGRGRSYRTDYSPPLFRMKSPNGTPYWVKLGYGYDGHSFKVWDDSIGNMLIDNWEIIFGTYTLDNSADVGKVFVSNLGDFSIPSGCALSVYVSNDGGNSWEPYNYNVAEAHIFTSVGNSLKVKLMGSGYPNKGPYKMSIRELMVHYSSTPKAVRESNVNYKVTRNRLTGGN